MVGEKPYLEYYGHLLRLDRRQAGEVVARYLDEQGDVVGLFVDVFMAALVHTGSEWERGKITVAHEHFISQVTSDQVRQLGPRLRVGPRLHAITPPEGPVAVASCVPGERHSIGLMMVCDVLRAAGFDVHELGEGGPPRAIKDFVLQSRADLLCLSCAVDIYLPDAADLIAMVRMAQPGITVAVGGAALRGKGDRVLRFLNADYTGADARKVQRLIPTWTGPHRQPVTS
jgi:methanogenic corrinoid protein MtbC1